MVNVRIAFLLMKGWQPLAVHTDVHARVRAIAAQENTTLSNVVARAVSLYTEVLEQAPDALKERFDMDREAV